MNVTWTALPSPLGSLLLVEYVGQPVVIEFAPKGGRMKWIDRLRTRHPDIVIDAGPCPATSAWLDGYFEGRPMPVHYPEHLESLMGPSAAENAVWRELCRIPVGATRSYEAVATATGLTARVVGQASGANHLALLIPCHRVVGKDGTLVGYGGGLERKRWLLDHELRLTGLVLS
ncbi:MAG: methylated-DNA--[protein]-cysteine S-methyltransferase [Gemmatimonadota bacterium]